MKQLIVNADDYGRTQGVSSGIRRAHINGIVTSTSVLMNMPSVLDDLQMLNEECPKMGVGVHLVLTKGEPVLASTKTSSLVSSSGEFFSVHEDLQIFDSFNFGDLYAEWKAQIEKALTTGIQIDHLDSHHHISYFHERAFEIMLRLAEEYQVPIRSLPPNDDFPDAEKSLHSREKRALDQSSVRHPGSVITTFYDQSVGLDQLISILNDLPEGTHELMCHPGYADEEIRSGSIYNIKREHELGILTNQKVKEVIHSQHIGLIRFSEILK